LLSVLAVCAVFASAAAFAADPVADFYKGKNVFFQVGSGSGGTYDVTGRAIAKHLGKHIPGNPVVVVQNVPGGGSLALANQFGNTSMRDGTVLGIFNNGMPTTPLLDPKAAHFDPRKFHFLGSLSREAHLYGVWHTSPIKKLEDVFQREVVVAGSAPGAAPNDFPRLTNALIGTKFKIITGYIDEGARRLAMQRGEVDGQAGSSWTTVRTAYKEMIEKKEFLVLAAFGMKQNKELPHVPLFSLGKNEEERQLFQLMYARQSFGKPIAMPPDVPAERVKAMQAALEATFKDKDFLADAEKLDLEIDPVKGEELTALTNDLFKTPAAVVDRMQKTLATETK
jgi:tripartite-type tricarboxylate transporter receptor subunit TctC